MSFKLEVYKITNELAELLIAKNIKYGNSALEPVRVFSKASATEQLLVRLDDKLSRLRTQSITEDEDVLQDLLGYLVLLKMSMDTTQTPCSDPNKDCLLGKRYELREGYKSYLPLVESLIGRTNLKSEFSQTDSDGNVTIEGTDITIPLAILKEV